MEKDYYAILGVARGASQDDIKKAYRALAHTHHPDKQTGDEAKFKEINEAYSVLGDAAKRAQYDRFGSAAFQGNTRGPQGFDFSHFGGGFDFGGTPFEDLFSDIFTGGTPRQQRGGADVQVDVTISFDEMVRGVERELSFRTQVACGECHGTGGAPGAKAETCSACGGRGQVRKSMNTILGTFSQTALCDACRGTGERYSTTCKHCTGAGRVVETVKRTVRIPAGIRNEQVLSLSGQGGAGEHGAPGGTLYVVVRVAPHPAFTRHGDDIHSELVLRFDQFALGDKVPVTTLEGEVMMKIPAGTQPGEMFRIKGKGVPRLGAFGRGDHLVRSVIRVPRHLSGEEKRLIGELRDVVGS
jgi:molecular chaperone DnaJ